MTSISKNSVEDVQYGGVSSSSYGNSSNNGVIVIDNGTGFTKMGYAGNEEPTYIIPSMYADNKREGAVQKDLLEDLNFSIGYEAAAQAGIGKVSYPITHGIVSDWDKMERMWQQCIYKYLRVEPGDYGFLLTEPPANPPENREYTAEVMFETFGVKQLYIAVQGTLALTASWNSPLCTEKGLNGCMTGMVVDSGDGVTHVIPIVDGYVINQAIRHIPLAGRDVTQFILERLRERQEPIPPQDIQMVAQSIKEKYCYIAADMAKEFNKYDDALPLYLSKHEEINPRTRQRYSFEIGYEKFLGPEIFFHPEIFSPDWTTPLHEVIDNSIWSCPIDTRRPLYKNIVLSGGSTMFTHFDRRLRKDLSKIVNARAKEYSKQLNDSTREIKYECNVISHDRQRYAVWYGGSVVGSSPEYNTVCHTRAQYEEFGPSICRQNAMFHSIF